MFSGDCTEKKTNSYNKNNLSTVSLSGRSGERCYVSSSFNKENGEEEERERKSQPVDLSTQTFNEPIMTSTSAPLLSFSGSPSPVFKTLRVVDDDSEINNKEKMTNFGGDETRNNCDFDNKNEEKGCLITKEQLQNVKNNDDIEKMQQQQQKPLNSENEEFLKKGQDEERTHSERKNNEEFPIPNEPKILSRAVKMTPRFVLLVMVCMCGFLVTGYQMAVVSGLLLLNKNIPVSNFWRQTLVGVASGVAMVITVTCGHLCDKIGRKYTVILSAVLAVLGSAMETSGLYYTLPGRISAGMSIGLSTLSVPIYLAENTAPSVRGPIIILNMGAITFGQLLSGIAAGAFSYVEKEGWRFLSGLIMIFSFLELFGFVFLPESSRFLAKKGQFTKSCQVMDSLWKGLPEKEFESMISDQNENEKHKQNSSFRILLNILQEPSIRRALFLGCSLHVINQMSGINIILFYSGIVVKMAGVDDDKVAVWLSTIPTLINFLGTFIGFYLIERIGRRLLLLTSTAGVFVSLLALSLTFWQIEVQSPQVSLVEHNYLNSTPCALYRNCKQCVSDPSCGFCYQDHPVFGPVNGSCLPTSDFTSPYSKQGRCNHTLVGDSFPFQLKWESDFCPSNLIHFIMAFQVLYLLFFSAGLGPLPWAICSEIYPTWARSICNSISSGVMWFFSWLMTGMFLSMIESLRTYGTFLLMSCITLVGWEFWYLCLPETKGKSLEETEMLFTKPFFCKKKKILNKKEQRV